MKKQLLNSFKNMNFDLKDVSIQEDNFSTRIIVNTKQNNKIAWNIATYLNETDYNYSITTTIDNETSSKVIEVEFMFEK